MNSLCMPVGGLELCVTGGQMKFVKALKLHLLILRLKWKPVLSWGFFGVTRELLCGLLCTFPEDGHLKN